MKKFQMKKIQTIAIVAVLGLVVAGCTPQSGGGNSNFSLVGAPATAPTNSVTNPTPPPLPPATPADTTTLPYATPTPTPSANLGPCTAVNGAASFQFYPYVPRETPTVLFECPNGTNITFTNNGPAQNAPLEWKKVDLSKRRIQIRAGWFTKPGTFNVGINVAQGSSPAGKSVSVQVYDRIVKKDSVSFFGIGQCSFQGPSCNQGTLFELTSGNWKCRYSEADITRIKGVHYVGNSSQLYYLPQSGTASCDQGGTLMSATSGLPQRCVLEPLIAGKYYVLSKTNHHNFWKDSAISNQTGTIRVACPFGSVSELGTYNSVTNNYSCNLWSIANGDQSILYKSGNKLYRTLPASGSCPVGSTLESGSCLIADFSGSSWAISFSADNRKAYATGKNVTCQ